jgi:hypothetical protein
MVIWSEESINDLEDILFALITWEKHKPLTLDAAKLYVEDVERMGNSIPKLLSHTNSTYDDHRAYGTKVCKYKRNPRTTWYIIYDWDEVNKIAYINKIMNNYMTVSV